MQAYELEVKVTKQSDGLWRAEVPVLKGCFVDAPKLSQALAELQQVAAMFLDVEKEDNPAALLSLEQKTEAPLRALLPIVIEEHSFRRVAVKAARPSKA